LSSRGQNLEQELPQEWLAFWDDWFLTNHLSPVPLTLDILFHLDWVLLPIDVRVRVVLRYLFGPGRLLTRRGQSSWLSPLQERERERKTRGRMFWGCVLSLSLLPFDPVRGRRPIPPS